MKPNYTIPESAKILEIRNGRLREWVDRQYIKPDKPAQFRGDNHRLSETNIFQAKLFQYLIHRGFMRRVAAEIAQQFKNRDFLCVTQKAGRFSYTWYDKNKAITLNPGVEDIFVINMKKIKDSVNLQAFPVNVETKDNV